MEVFALMVALALVFLVWSWWNAPARLVKRKMRALPLVPLHQAEDGQVARFRGQLVLGESHLVAPISKRRCGAWRLRVVEDRGEDGVRVHVDEQESTSFILKDGEHIADVDGSEVALAADIDAKGHNGWFSDATEALEAFLRTRGIEQRGWLLKKAFRFEEGVLEEGELVSVAGRCRWERDTTQVGTGYRDVGRRLHIDALEDGKVLATDDASLTKA